MRDNPGPNEHALVQQLNEFLVANPFPSERAMTGLAWRVAGGRERMKGRTMSVARWNYLDGGGSAPDRRASL